MSVQTESASNGRISVCHVMPLHGSREQLVAIGFAVGPWHVLTVVGVEGDVPAPTTRLTVSFARSTSERPRRDGVVVAVDQVCGAALIELANRIPGDVSIVRLDDGPLPDEFQATAIGPESEDHVGIRPSSDGTHIAGMYMLQTAPRPNGWLSGSPVFYRGRAVGVARGFRNAERYFLPARNLLEATTFGEFLQDVVRREEAPSGADIPDEQARRPPSRFRATAAADTIDGPDALGIGREVTALADIIAARDVEPPLSIGLFGDWGSGKSFFMRRIRDRVAQAHADHHCDRIVQIEFNAWHYADTNLWACLVTQIFDRVIAELNEKAPAVDPRQVLSQRLTSAQQLLSAAEERRAKADADRTAADHELERLRDAKVQTAVQLKAVARSAPELLRSAAATRDVEKQLSAVANQNGVRLETLKGELGRTIDDAEGIFANARAAARIVRSEHRTITIATAIAILALPVGLVWLLRNWAGIDAWVKTVTGVGMVGAVLIARQFLGIMRPLSRGLRQALETAERITTEDLRQKLTELDARVDAAIEVGKTADAEIRAAHQEIDDIKSGRVLLRAIKERAEGGEYQKQLGLISMIRKDFEELSKVIAVSREVAAADSDADFGIERIVLYIDDLDRCPEDKVVEVLQAIHLLLASRLFVIVVAVDSRWLLHSLAKQYPVALKDGPEWEAVSTPQQYLEKIFQIPFVIRPMSAEGYQRLVRSLVAVAPDPNRVVAAADSSAPQPQAESSSTEPAPDPNIYVPVSGNTPQQPAITTNLSSVEIALLEQMAPLISSPRSTKRFVNCYRLMRAMLSEQQRDMLESEDAAEIVRLLARITGNSTEAERICRAAMDDASPAIRDWIPLVSRFSFATGLLRASKGVETGPDSVKTVAGTWSGRPYSPA